MLYDVCYGLFTFVLHSRVPTDCIICPGNTKGVQIEPLGFFELFPKPAGIFREKIGNNKGFNL